MVAKTILEEMNKLNDIKNPELDHKVKENMDFYRAQLKEEK